MLKNLEKNALNELYKIIYDCYIRGVLPMGFIKSKTTTIPKNGNGIKSVVNQNVGEVQFGFRRGKGTREAILELKIILESRLNTNTQRSLI